jgi:hypothetical protein
MAISGNILGCCTAGRRLPRKSGGSQVPRESRLTIPIRLLRAVSTPWLISPRLLPQPLPPVAHRPRPPWATSRAPAGTVWRWFILAGCSNTPASPYTPGMSLTAWHSSLQRRFVTRQSTHQTPPPLDRIYSIANSITSRSIQILPSSHPKPMRTKGHLNITQSAKKLHILTIHSSKSELYWHSFSQNYQKWHHDRVPSAALALCLTLSSSQG